MNDKTTSVGEGLSKPELVLEFWAFRPRFLARIRQRVWSNACAEDIFQEACLKFLASEAVFVYPQAGTRYFCRILRSLIADHFERAWRLEYRENVPEPSWDPWPEEEERQLTERVCEAFGRLASKDQHSLAAYFSPDADGHEPKRSRGTVRRRACIAVRKLRAMVGEES